MLFTLVEELDFIKAYCYLLHRDLVTCYNILFMQSETCMPIPTLLANDQWESKSDRTSVYYLSE